MNRRMFLTLNGSVAMCALVPFTIPGFAAPAQNAGAEQTKAIAAAALALLDLLSDDQRQELQFPFTRQPKAIMAHFKGGMRGDVDMIGEQYGKSMWSNFPVSDVARPGLRLGSLNDAQRSSTMAMLSVLLSDRGYRKMLEIMGSDQVLADTATPYASGRAAYTLAIFGTPNIDTPWMIQFGGHHLALNVTLSGDKAVLAPVLTGCLPAIYTEDGKRIRALAAENDKAFALLDSLDDAQRKQAIIDHPVSLLVLGPGHDDETVPPVGVKVSVLDQSQRGLLYDLILEWVGILNDVHAAPRLAEIRNGLEDMYFAWSGPTTREPNRNGASYFRIQGPRLFVEFSPQEPGGDLTMHVHTIYRDPFNAYGRGIA
ncbi:DUF3500 domain-containing protein [Xanthobacter sp. VTT E-85241]|uniref:DUF3500 domain-containing protein n=1 Tax=Roseixanthobacter finlandensis TaxID=3119922 RepID=UPI003728784F